MGHVLAPPDSPRRKPVPVGDLLGSVLSSRVQAALLDLEFLTTLWHRVVPEGIARRAVPVSVEKRVLTIVTDDPVTRAEAHRRRTEIARSLVRAAGLPKARLRVRVALGVPRAVAATRGESGE